MLTVSEKEQKLLICRQIIEKAREITDAGGGKIQFVPDRISQQGIRLYYSMKAGADNGKK